MLILLPACGSSPPVVTQTELVEVEVCEGQRVPVSGDLTKPVPKQTIPEGITYRELIELLIRDRAGLDQANGQLEAIKELHGGER